MINEFIMADYHQKNVGFLTVIDSSWKLMVDDGCYFEVSGLMNDVGGSTHDDVLFAVIINDYY